MASALVAAFVAVKLGNAEQSRALYAVASERGGPEVIARMQAVSVAAIAAMLQTAPDAHFHDPKLTAVIVLSAMVGPVRTVLERQGPPGLEAQIEGQLVRLVTAYLQTHQLGP
jgi:hypothetical protein